MAPCMSGDTNLQSSSVHSHSNPAQSASRAIEISVIPETDEGPGLIEEPSMVSVEGYWGNGGLGCASWPIPPGGDRPAIGAFQGPGEIRSEEGGFKCCVVAGARPGAGGRF